MNSNEIKKANRKALPKFLLIVVISFIVGGMIGFFSVEWSLGSLSDNIKMVGEVFGVYFAPWLMLSVAIIVPVISIPKYRKAKKLLDKWDGENEEICDKFEEKLSIIIWFTGAALIISYFLLSASYSEGFTILDNEDNILPFIIGITAFAAILIESIIIQQKCVDAVKKTNPEKTTSVYDVKFKKKWMDSCDEAEKILIGKCAFKAYSATNTLCAVLAPALAVCALIFGMGFLPSLVVCIIWIVNHSVYCKESLKYSKAGNKIS
ncbi:MAG: DUF3169 family protein [Ruminococcus sp.]